jgi:predicted ABC-type exoprotein transport system permease subunit
VFAWLESTEFSAWERGSSLLGWPFSLTVHAFGTALVVGFIFIINLRLLGLFETIPYTSLKRLFPVVWAALVLQLLSGFALWMTKPTRYVVDTAFLLKLVFLIVGIVLTSYLFATMKREAASWEASGAVSSNGFKLVAPSLLVWCAVLITGRLTAHLGSLFG